MVTVLGEPVVSQVAKGRGFNVKTWFYEGVLADFGLA
jgi:hypothetical protein